MQQIDFYIIAVQWKRETQLNIITFLLIFLIKHFHGNINQVTLYLKANFFSCLYSSGDFHCNRTDEETPCKMRLLHHLSELVCVGKTQRVGKTTADNQHFPILFTSLEQLKPEPQCTVALTWLQCSSVAWKSRTPYSWLFGDLIIALLNTWQVYCYWYFQETKAKSISQAHSPRKHATHVL